MKYDVVKHIQLPNINIMYWKIKSTLIITLSSSCSCFVYQTCLSTLSKSEIFVMYNCFVFLRLDTEMSEIGQIWITCNLNMLHTC